MKKKVLVKKLGLNKSIISNLNTEEKTTVKGGKMNTGTYCSYPVCHETRINDTCFTCYPCIG